MSDYKRRHKAISALTKSDGWRILQEIMREELLASAINLSDRHRASIEDIHFQRGAIWAARQFIDMPTKLLAYYENQVLLDEANSLSAMADRKVSE